MLYIKGYEGLYAILPDSTLIRVMRQSLQNGYKRVGLTKNKKQKGILVHRAVAEAFIPNPHNLPCVNHKNGIKTDNRVENLEWCTYAQNMQHAFDTGLHNNGEKSYQAKLTEKDVLEIKGRYKFRGKDNMYSLAKEFGVAPSTIGFIISGKNWKHIRP